MSLFSSVYFSIHSIQAQSSSHLSHPSFLNKRRKVPRTPVPVPRPVQALLAFNPGAIRSSWWRWLASRLYPTHNWPHKWFLASLTCFVASANYSAFALSCSAGCATELAAEHMCGGFFTVQLGSCSAQWGGDLEELLTRASDLIRAGLGAWWLLI
ncbi:uncharacterized protein K441DRAFT_25450 [Cenococcum geophilum 1.58]|uniref:uncharacterized protein n=1 Tax=Cenococcum geophilum 1.58 TaxID=794803 RepID=UPI00358F6098|nr:hypothetical protein K441DRAFT_25450 [Cenococcum geophilum 1.58]